MITVEPTADATTTFATDSERALERLGIDRPYFALDDIEYLGDGTARCSIPASPPVAPETGVMAAAQVARHLAILGSCAAALGRPDAKPHHYLATTAVYETLTDADTVSSGPFTATATAAWADKRNVSATMLLQRGGGDAINRLTVSYVVMKPQMFSRFNPPLESTPPATSAGLTISPTLTIGDNGMAYRDCGLVSPDMCAGHFPGNPNAPVALLMGQLVETAATAMAHHLGCAPGYRVIGGTVEAAGLAKAGQHLTMTASYKGASTDGHLCVGTAKADGETVGTVEVRLRSAPQG